MEWKERRRRMHEELQELRSRALEALRINGVSCTRADSANVCIKCKTACTDEDKYRLNLKSKADEESTLSGSFGTYTETTVVTTFREEGPFFVPVCHRCITRQRVYGSGIAFGSALLFFLFALLLSKVLLPLDYSETGEYKEVKEAILRILVIGGVVGSGMGCIFFILEGVRVARSGNDDNSGFASDAASNVLFSRFSSLGELCGGTGPHQIPSLVVPHGRQ
jgi:hypothetical protein